MKLRMQLKNVFNPDHLLMEGKHESRKRRQNILLGIFADS